MSENPAKSEERTHLRATRSGGQAANSGTQALHAQLTKRLLVLDGAMGTMIQSYKLDEGGFRGERFRNWTCDLKGCNDLLNITQPRIVQEIHRQYLEGGADIIETNSFGANRYKLAEHGLEQDVVAINQAAVNVATTRAGSATTRRIREAAGISCEDNGTTGLTQPEAGCKLAPNGYRREGGRRPVGRCGIHGCHDPPPVPVLIWSPAPRKGQATFA